MSPLEMARVYAMMANHGKRVRPRLILEIKDFAGDTILLDDESDSDRAEDKVQVVSKEAAYLITRMMKEVLSPGGTGYLVGRILNDKLEVAGKTGTSQNYRDLWFAGFSPELCTVVWIGHDQDLPLSGGGGVIAGPIFAKYMKDSGKYIKHTSFSFDNTYDFRSESVCKLSGKVAVAGKCPDIDKNAQFISETEPSDYCSIDHFSPGGKALQKKGSSEIQEDGYDQDIESLEERRSGSNKLSEVRELVDPKTEKSSVAKIKTQARKNALASGPSVFDMEITPARNHKNMTDKSIEPIIKHETHEKKPVTPAKKRGLKKKQAPLQKKKKIDIRKKKESKKLEEKIKVKPKRKPEKAPPKKEDNNDLTVEDIFP